MDFTEPELSDYGLIQGISFVMLLAGRIDARILEAARKVNMTRKELVRLMSPCSSAVVHNRRTEVLI